jgi:IcmF-related N-terminal domain
MGSLTMFMNLPLPIKAAIFVVTGGGIMGLMFFLTTTGMIGNSLTYLLLIAVAIAAAVFALYKIISKKMSKRKAKPFEEKMAESASATPSGVSDPGSRAKLDDLRKRFEEGISVFKEHGKDIYTMPWYVIVGEPGSGKTEAMRHSNVGFPPGLQDQLQGVGGTVNMHWWFTNHAVMIDTAGRLMFDEVVAGNVDEWAEFLKMLRTARPNCPLNGMLLVIPADSLIKDSANDIEKKGGKIAQQLDNIQRALGVRFPVYIVISKADRVNGFREFFEELTDPVMQMQMLGWTNPNDLDTPFDPSMVEQHLTTVRERLIRRRFSLLADPVNSDDPMGRRIDEVDALYAFPDSLVKLAPRLRRYLEMVFVAGEWSQKPLFLRGIYFTSSMREGDALDADLAEVLGVQVDALKEGKLWERDRSYFLKDVFMEKVFREKGLVTRESNVGKSRRRQSLILITCGTVLALAAGLWTYFAYTRLEKSIETPRREWAPIAKLVEQDMSNATGSQRNPNLALVQPFSGDYFGERSPDDDSLTRLQVQRTAWSYAERRRKGTLKTDPIFWFAAATTGSVFDRMVETQQILFDRYAIGSFVQEARWRIGNPVDEANRGKVEDSPRGASWWSPSAVAALGVLLEIESAGLGSEVEYSRDDYLNWVVALGFYPDLLGGERRRFLQEDDEYGTDWDLFGEEEQGFLADVLFASFGTNGKGKGGHASIAKTFAVDSEESIAIVESGVNSFVSSWRAGGGGDGSLLGLLDKFAKVGQDYRAAENAVLGFPEFKNAKTSEEFEAARVEWLRLVAILTETKDKLDILLSTEVQASPREPDKLVALIEVLSNPTEVIQNNAMKMATSEVNSVIEGLVETIPSTLTAEDDGRTGVLFELRKKLSEHKANYVTELDQEVATTMSAIKGDGNSLIQDLTRDGPSGTSPVYVIRYETIARSASQIQTDRPETPDVFEFASVTNTLSGEVESTRETLAQSDTDQLANKVDVVCRAALDAYEGYYKSRWVLGVLNDLKGQSLASLVENSSIAANANERGADFETNLPLLSTEDGKLDRKYDDIVAQKILASIQELGDQVAPSGNDDVGQLLDVAKINDAWSEVGQSIDLYRTGYTDYWLNKVPLKYRPHFSEGGKDAWSKAYETLGGMDDPEVFDALYEVTKRTREAISAIGAGESNDAVLVAYSNALQEDEQGLLQVSGGLSLRGRASEMVLTWEGLSNDLGTARSRLFRHLDVGVENKWTDSKILEEYFANVRDDLTPARRYWSGVASVMLTAMSSSLGNEEVSKRDELWVLGSKFPFALNSSDEMTVGEFDTASELVDWLLLRASSVGAGGGQTRKINGLPERARDALRSLQGGTALGNEQVKLLREVGQVTSAIQETGEITIKLGSRTQNESFIEEPDDHVFVRVMQGGQPVDSEADRTELARGTNRIDREKDQKKDLLSLAVPASGLPIGFQFWATESDYKAAPQGPKTTGVLRMPWHGLLALRDGEKVDGGWLLPLKMTSGSGQYKVLVTGLMESLPEDWPTTDDWDKAGN